MLEREELTALVKNVQKGDPDAIAALCGTYYSDVYYFILKTVKDPDLACDLTQDTFEQILQSIGTLEEPAAYVSWSRQIAYHKCTDHFRKRKELLLDDGEEGRSPLEDRVVEDPEFIPDQALESEELKKTILGMLDALPPEQRSAMYMRYYDELSVQEIARIQGVPEGTVKSRLNYGRRTVKSAVERYEKKNGVKLHCAGVVPLLLWLFRGQRAVSRASAVTGAAGTVAAVTKTAAVASRAAATSETVAEAASTAAEAGAEVGRKATGKLAAKLIAGFTATAVASSGVTAGIMASRQQPEAVTEPTAIVEELPMEWSGYGDSPGSTVNLSRYDMSVAEMDDESIRGELVISRLYGIEHSTAFTGEGTASGDRVLYEIEFEIPQEISGFGTYEYTGFRMTYDKNNQTMTVDTLSFDVVMERATNQPQEVLAENVRWSAMGKDLLYGNSAETHLFELDVRSMTETEISGTLTVSCDGYVDHKTAFTGRGYAQNGCSYYEICLETARSADSLGGIVTVDYFWMTYDRQQDTFTVNTYYEAEMTREK